MQPWNMWKLSYSFHLFRLNGICLVFLTSDDGNFTSRRFLYYWYLCVYLIRIVQRQLWLFFKKRPFLSCVSLNNIWYCRSSCFITSAAKKIHQDFRSILDFTFPPSLLMLYYLRGIYRFCVTVSVKASITLLLLKFLLPVKMSITWITWTWLTKASIASLF